MISDIEQRVERSIFHALRKKLVEWGYLPDITTFDVENPDITIATAAQAAYEAAMVTIHNDKGFVIEVFNFASNQNLGIKKVPRIVVEIESFMIGQLGVDPSKSFITTTEGSYTAVQYDSMLSDFYFNIHLVANDAKQSRLLHQVMVNALPRRGYIKWYDQAALLESQNLLVRYVSNADFSFLSEGIIEKVYRYEIPDLHETLPNTIATNIAGINVIKVDTVIGGTSNELDINTNN